MKTFQRGFTLFEGLGALTGLAWLVVWVLAGIGWIWNIVKISHTMPGDFAHATPLWVCRVVGVFAAPLGAILGFC